MTGLLASQRVRVSQARIGESLRRTIPHNHQKRITSTAKLLNPVLNTAEYFGHKVHVDQNKKLVMYGVTRVCTRWIQWKSGRIHYIASKNNIEIYKHLFRYM